MHLHRWQLVRQNLTDYSKAPTLEHGYFMRICARCGKRKRPRNG